MFLRTSLIALTLLLGACANSNSWDKIYGTHPHSGVEDVLDN